MFASRWELADAGIGLLTVIGCAARWAGHQIAPADQRDRQQMARITVITSSGPRALVPIKKARRRANGPSPAHRGVVDEQHE